MTEQPRRDGGGAPPAALAPITSYWHMLLISVLNVSAINAIRPMVSYRALQLGAGTFEIGVVASSYALLSLLTAVLVGRWVDRFGAGPFLLGGGALCAACAIGAIFIDSIAALAFGQALLGLAHIMNLVATQTTIANGTARAQRDERFGWYGVAASSGQLIGPAAAGFIAGMTARGAATSDFDPRPVFVFAAVLALAASLQGGYLWWRQPRGVRGAGSMASGHFSAAAEVLRRPNMPRAMLVSVAVILSVDLLVAYLPAFGEANLLPVELVGLLLALRAGGSMISRLFMGRLINALGRVKVLMWSMLLAGACLAALPFITLPAVLMALMLVMGVGLGLGQPMTIAWVANNAPRHQRGTALAVRLTGNRLGQLVVPSAMGALAGAAGLNAIFWILAAALGAGATLVSRTALDDPAPQPLGGRDGGMATG
jgi:MFS family permease